MAVNNVESKVESIGSVVDTSRSISAQTKLLALNAAIEVPRGAAVVATKYRTLRLRFNL